MIGAATARNREFPDASRFAGGPALRAVGGRYDKRSRRAAERDGTVREVLVQLEDDDESSGRQDQRPTRCSLGWFGRMPAVS